MGGLTVHIFTINYILNAKSTRSREVIFHVFNCNFLIKIILQTEKVC